MLSKTDLITPAWSCPDNVVAYTSTRNGGISRGIYEGLNVGAHVGDDLAVVKQNRSKLPLSSKITWLEQVHGCTVATLPTTAITADAAYTDKPEQFCAVMTADCVPILLCDTAGSEVAAVHAGWKGLDIKIIAETLRCFSNSPSSIMAWIGPAICNKCYEVDSGVAFRFSQYDGVVTPSKNSDKYYLNLPLIAQLQLNSLGVNQVTQSCLCTYCESHMFYSHRKATHDNAKATGRIVSAIGFR